MKKLFVLLILLASGSTLYSQQILSLEDSKELSLKNNSLSKNSRLELEASKQISKSSFTNYFPNISAGGMIFESEDNLMEMETHGGDLPVYDGNPDNLSSAAQFAYFPSSTMGLLKKGTIGFVNIIQPIFAGGRILNGNKLASLGEEIFEYKLKLSQDDILLKTEEQYWQLISLDEKYKTITDYEKMLNQILIQVEDAFKSGIVMRNDLLKVKLQLNELLLNKSELENGRRLAKMAFCQFVGIDYDSTLVLNEKLNVSDIPQSIFIDKDEALLKRTEYSLLEKSVEAEKLQTRMKLGEYLPQAGIGLSGMYMKLDEAKERTVGLVFGTVSVPISAWWGGYHELQERAIKEKITENNFKNNSELLLLQIEKSWQDLNNSYRKYLLSEESKVQAEENSKVNTNSFNNGLTTVSDLLEAQALLQQTYSQLIDSKVNYITKRSRYLRQTGRE
ncbi:MAG: TolC family protein [Melioribacteraceae bacterium]